MRSSPRPSWRSRKTLPTKALFNNFSGHGYVGQYQLAPTFILNISREGDQLFVEATGQPKFEIFPEGARDYFLKVVDAQITFETDTQGKATGLILHQNGMNQPAKCIQ